MSRSYKQSPKHWWTKESKLVRDWCNRKWRREGKKLGPDAPPQKGTGGWLTH